MIYYNSITLEVVGLRDSRFKNFFEYDIILNTELPLATKLIMCKIRSAPNFFYDSDKLMELDICSHRIFYKYSDFVIKKIDIVLKNLLLKKLDNKSIVRYKDLL
jgi:hypothetical protein